MNITTYQKNAFTVIRFVDPVELLDDIHEVRTLVETAVESGRTSIAVRFTEDSALRSAAMATLVLCAALVNSHGGTFALIDPSEHIVSLLRIFSAEDLVRVAESEDSLQATATAPRPGVHPCATQTHGSPASPSH